MLTSIRKSCTGTVVGSANGSVVDTAAHCFYDNKGQLIPAKQMQFCPQYRKGEKPLGCWTGQQTLVAPHYVWMPPDKWVSPPEMATDYGFLVVSHLEGKMVATVVAGGVTALASALVGKNPVVAYGYPDTAAMSNGEELYTCMGSLVTRNTSNGQALRLEDCVLGKGASGGPWFATINQVTYLIGHTVTGDSSSMYSPSFDTSGWFALLAQAAQVPVN